MSTSAYIRGLPELLAKLRALPIVVARGAEEGNTRAAARVAQAAEGFAPHLTGELAASIGSEGNEAFATARHAPFQEFGTSHNDAQPFFEPAIHAEEGALVQDVSTAARAAIMRLV